MILKAPFPYFGGKRKVADEIWKRFGASFAPSVRPVIARSPHEISISNSFLFRIAGCHKRPVIAGPAGGNAPLPDNEDLRNYFQQLAERLRRVRVCCGDWSRVCGPSVTVKHGLTAVFLDPPYADTANRADNLYRKDCNQVAHAVRDWAVEQGKNPLMRIALAGYDGEHEMPDNWLCWAWNAGEGFGGQKLDGKTGNGKKERIWFSPHCANPEPELFK